jgi:murein DD-endopeptidase MepM/ murein hydrolase activator NlpD
MKNYSAQKAEKQFQYKNYALIYNNCVMARIKRALLIFIAVIAIAALMVGNPYAVAEEKKDFIKWVDFNASNQIIQKCYEYDVNSYNSLVHYNFIELLSYVTTRNSNNFKYENDIKYLKVAIDKLNLGQSMNDIIGDNKYYRYYYGCYEAVFAGFLNEFIDEDTNEVKYGLTAYHPIARGYWYSGSNDFGNARNYGFRRRHLGHDMYGSVGTPIISVEGGTVTEFGWNRYGGWRVGIRSFDGKRYYYYAHLRKDKPYALGIEKGSKVKAGQVIGYLGVTGYSYKENVNMNTRPHLHFGLQLIFDESQVDGNGEIWIDVFSITRFLAKNRASVIKNQETGEYNSVDIRRPLSRN